MIETSLLEALCAFADTGTLSGAAEQLHTSQPAISRSMKRLEEEIGVPLFERKKNRMELNENGLLALQHARGILRHYEDLLLSVRELHRRNTAIAFASCASAPLSDMTLLLRQLYPASPITSELRDITVLSSGVIDKIWLFAIGINMPSDPMLRSIPYAREKLYFCLPENHPKAHWISLSLSDLDGENILLHSGVGFWKQLCTRKMPHAHFVLQDDFRTFMELVKMSGMVSFTTDVIMRTDGLPEGHTAVPIRDAEVSVTYYLIFRRENGRRLEPLFAALKDRKMTPDLSLRRNERLLGSASITI